jgi:hypothetical protein
MLEERGNIWKYYNQENLLVVPTNGTVKSNGECVMGRGLALQVKTKLPSFPKVLGTHIKEYGNIVGYFPIYALVSFPVKWDWHKDADKLLIDRSLNELVYLVKLLDLNTSYKGSLLKTFFKVYLTRVGCGNGNLDWADIKPMMSKVLSGDRFVVVDRQIN